MSSSANTPVIDAIRSHHARLAAELHELTGALVAAAGSAEWQAGRDRLGEWYRTELIPHAIAEEAKLYAAGADRPTTALLVRGMTDEHRQIVALVAELALSRDVLHACTTAVAAEQLFISHLGKENDLLLPALDELGIDFDTVLEGMHEILGRQAAPESAGVAITGAG